MQVRKPYSFILPNTIIIEISKISCRNNENYFLLINKMLNKMMIFKDEEYHSLDHKKITKQYGFDSYAYTKKLCNSKVFISDDFYIKGLKSKRYKLNPNMLNDFTIVNIQPNSKIFNAINKEVRLKNNNYYKFPPYLKAMHKRFISLEMDNQITNEILCRKVDEKMDCFQWISLENSIHRFNDKRLRFFKRNTTNKRLDSNLTNINKCMRFAIQGDFVTIDLKNSQPLILSLLFKNLFNEIQGNKNIINENYNNTKIQNKTLLKSMQSLCSLFSCENIIKTFGNHVFSEFSKTHNFYKNSKYMSFSSFFNSCLDGTFYNRFIDFFCYDLTRDDVKKIMFSVMFSKNKTDKNFIPYKKEKDLFSSIYPDISALITILKKNDNSLLPILLQTIESKIFIDIICPLLYENGITPAFTIHDSVVVDAKDFDKSLEIIKNIFNDIFGVIPQFGIELIGTANYKPAHSSSTIKVA